MKVYKHKHSPLIDVFTGEGWLNWGRYLFKQGRLIFVAGQKLDRPTFNDLTQQLADDHARTQKQ